MKKVYIGMDESYDANQLGYFVLNALLITNEHDKNSLDKFIEKINIQKGYEEIKGNKVSDGIKLKIIKKLNSLDCINCYSKVNFKEKNYELNVEDAYLNCLSRVIENIIEEIQNIDEDIVCDIDIDKIAGDKFQKEARKVIARIFKKYKIRHNIKFVNSKNSYIVQTSDVLAGENRIGSKSKIIEHIKLNKPTG